MRFAYADPPYLGNGKRLYAPFHSDSQKYDTHEAHYELITKLLSDYPDGWALSCNPKDLVWILPRLPATVRVCAWVKTFHQIRVNVSIQYAWEAVIVSGGRDMRHRRPMTRDYLSSCIAMRKGLPGAKPNQFYNWLIDVLGWQENDEIIDLFPGTYGLQKVIEQRVHDLSAAKLF